MSISFTTAMSDITAHTFTCGHDNGRTAHRFGSYQDAESFLIAELEARGNTGHLSVCGDEFCQQSRMFIQALEADPAPVVNMANDNARHILEVLGYDPREDFGSATPEDFAGRVLMAVAVNPSDAGTATVEDCEEGKLSVINCGRPEGYTDDRLAELRGLVEFATRTGRSIQWG